MNDLTQKSIFDKEQRRKDSSQGKKQGKTSRQLRREAAKASSKKVLR